MICGFLTLFTGHFENILSDDNVNDQTKILVVNAAYFVGKWMKKFPESETKECPFRVNKVCGAASQRVPAIDLKITVMEGTAGIHSREGSEGAGRGAFPGRERTKSRLSLLRSPG